MSASLTLHAEDFCTVTGNTDPDSLAFEEADWEIRALERGAEDAGAVFAINAGFLNMKKLIPTVYFRIGKEVY